MNEDKIIQIFFIVLRSLRKNLCHIFCFFFFELSFIYTHKVYLYIRYTHRIYFHISSISNIFHFVKLDHKMYNFCKDISYKMF